MTDKKKEEPKRKVSLTKPPTINPSKIDKVSFLTGHDIQKKRRFEPSMVYRATPTIAYFQFRITAYIYNLTELLYYTVSGEFDFEVTGEIANLNDRYHADTIEVASRAYGHAINDIIEKYNTETKSNPQFQNLPCPFYTLQEAQDVVVKLLHAHRG